MDKELLKTLTIFELAKLQKELLLFPEDKEDWKEVMEEIKTRSLQNQ